MRTILICLLAGLTAVARAQSPLSRSEQTFIDFGFATQLGSGVYAMSGRTLQVYRLPFAYEFKGDESARIRWRLTLPVTFGILDFEPIDVIDTGLPDSLDALSFVPGIEVDIPLRADWRIQPFVESGVARDKTSDLDERVHSAGLRSYYEFGKSATDWLVYEELMYVVVEQRSLDHTNDFTRLRFGVTGRRAFDAAGKGRRPDYLVYGFVDAIPNPPDGTLQGESGEGNDPQVEFGVTFGMTETVRVWGIPLPRLGIGYRHGSNLSVYRIVFGGPF